MLRKVRAFFHCWVLFQFKEDSRARIRRHWWSRWTSHRTTVPRMSFWITFVHVISLSSRRTIFNPSIPKAKRIIYESDRIEANVNLQLMMCLLLLCVCFLCHVYQVVWHCLVHSLEQTWIRLNRILKGTCTPFYFIPSNVIAMWLDDLRSDFMASCERCQPICWFDFEMTYVLKTYAQVRISHRASELVRGPRDLIAWVRSVLISHEEEA